MEKKFSIIKLIRALLLILILIFAVITIVAKVYFRSSLGSYYAASSKAFVIPGLNDGFVPQGIAYDKESDCFFITGYFNEGAAPIYIIDRAGNTKGYVELMNNDGSELENHAGGIAIHDEFIYIAGCDECTLFVYDYSEVVNAESGASVESLGNVIFKSDDEDYLKADCMTTTDDAIYVTEFYRSVGYPTAPSHEITTASGKVNKAFTVKFLFDNTTNSNFGICDTPDTVISTPDLAQGVYVEGDKILFSESYGADKSSVEVYDLQKADNNRSVMVLGREVRLLEMDEKSLINKQSLPPMSEEIVIAFDKLYTMCESAANKYVFGKFTSAEYCYATELGYFYN